MVRLLGLSLGESAESPREITSRSNLTSESSENGWLIRFFDSAFFCEWIAVSYLYKHEHAGVRDYLCNRMYTLPLSGIESYLFQICYMLIHKPSPSLDKFVIDICSKSLMIALKVHWFLLAELEDSDDNDGISRIQEKCQIAATLMGEWPPLMRPHTENSSSGSKNQVLNKLLSSKQKFLSLTSSPPAQRSVSFSPSSGNNLHDDGGQCSPEENKIFKKFIPGPKVRDALLFRKSVDKDEEDSEKDGFLKRLMRDSSKKEDEELTSSSDGFFKRLLRDSNRSEDEEVTSGSDGFFKRLLKDAGKGEEDELTSPTDGFFKKLLKDHNKGEEEELTVSSEGFFKKFFRDSKGDGDDRLLSKSMEDVERDGFFRKFFKDKFDDKKEGNERLEDGRINATEKFAKSAEDDEKDGFFRKLFKDKSEKYGPDKVNDMNVNCEEEESSDLSLFRKLFRVHPEDVKSTIANESNNNGHVSLSESSPGTEKFFRKLFRDRDRSVEDSELLSAKKSKERPGSPKQQNDKSNAKPPLPNQSVSQLRKGAYHESLDFVLSLCETSYGLVDVFPVEDRKSALRESLTEINLHLADAQPTGGVCFPMGKGMYRVVHIPEDEAVLLNSREKAPYMICVEVLKSEMPSNSKDTSGAQKLSRGGIPLANGDALLQKPPPWAYPLWTTQEAYRNSSDRMSRSTAEAIDQAMSHSSEAKLKVVTVSLSVERRTIDSRRKSEAPDLHSGIHRSNLRKKAADGCDIEWVRVVLTSDSGARMEHRRVPSTIAIEEVKAAAAKGEAPPGLPLKGAGQESSDAQPRVNGGIPRATDPLSGELWEAKKDRIRKASAHGKLPGWELRSVIVKSGDDCRQEHLAVQLISHFYDIFQEAGLPLWLRPYEVLVTSSYTALIETVPDTASIHSIKSRYANVTSLRDFFVAKYKENSSSFKLAQRNFVESMAGYSLVCYLLQLKDRHNGNLLLDEEGHIIHIDFGFMLSNSPGGVNFESAPFKLTRELLEVMDSDAEGVPSEFFDYFKVLCIQGFLTCRKHAERIILLVEMLQDSGFPCFKGGPRTIQNLRKRFHLSLTEEALSRPLSVLEPRSFVPRGISFSTMSNSDSVTYLNQRQAAEIDEILMGPLGFSVDQLMELAGLSVAAAIAEVYKPTEYNRVLAICGPGNNGGDGLVAARHLFHFGYKPVICYPKRTPKPLYSGLVTQLESLSVPFVAVEDLPSDLSKEFNIIIDAMFGFSFHGSPRPPFDDLIQKLVHLHDPNVADQRTPCIISVDIPSGWHVEDGDVNGGGIKPDMLVSLTAPKLGAKKFLGMHHFLGGRFVPPTVRDKYKLCLPPYPGSSMFVRIGNPAQVDISALRENYISPEFLEERVAADPYVQFRRWFDEAVEAGLKEPNAMSLSTVGKEGKPSSRMVLLKGFDHDGFVWYTNYESKKAHDLSENPRASLLFYWPGLNRQVRVEGSVQKVSEEESTQYYHSRPRGSQMGAIVSKQSSVIPRREVLYQEYEELQKKFSDGSVIPKPVNWGGYRLKPELFEFWQGQQSRLHDRLQYTPEECNGKRVWRIVRLAP
ncbi:Phosphatidylinositol 4-kinase beta 1 [Linum perenne]